MKIKIFSKLVAFCADIYSFTIFNAKKRRIFRYKYGLEKSNYKLQHEKYNLGEYSYLAKGTTIINAKETTIGKFCSISYDVLIGLSQHPTNLLTTHPFIYCSEKDNIADNLIVLPEEKRIKSNTIPPIHIGNDVWIGQRAIIMDGVTIGDGAIIGAGTIVTKDIEPYSIVVGHNRIVKKRFDDQTIEKLLKLKWWDKPVNFIKQLPFDNIESCIYMLENYEENNN